MADGSGGAAGAGLSRRRFLGLSLGGAALLALGGLFVEQESGYDLPGGVRARLRIFGAKEYLVFAAAARRLCDPGELPAAPAPDALDLAGFADGFLATAARETQRDVARLLSLFEHGPILFAFAPSRFTRLAPSRQDDYLWSWADSRLGIKRAGFAALKSLAMMGYYRDPRAWALVGYDGPLVPPGWRPGWPPPSPSSGR